MTNFNPRWHLVHTHLQAKRMAAWPLARQWYSIYPPPYLKRWRQARHVGTIAGLPLPPIGRMTQRCRSIQSLVRSGDEPVCILERMGSVLQASARSLGSWIFARASHQGTRHNSWTACLAPASDYSRALRIANE